MEERDQISRDARKTLRSIFGDAGFQIGAKGMGLQVGFIRS